MSYKTKQLHGDKNDLSSVYSGSVTALDSTQGYIVTASGPVINVYNPRFKLLKCLNWTDAFPVGRGKADVDCICIDPVTKNISATSTSHVAVFRFSEDDISWKVQSSFHVLSDVVDIDLRKDVMLLATDTGLSIWSLDKSKTFSTWKSIYEIKIPEPICSAKLSLEGNYIASFTNESNEVKIYDIELNLLSRLAHPYSIHCTVWRSSSTLSTQDVKGTVRLWTTMIDEPDLFVLWTVIQPTGTGIDRCVWLDSDKFNDSNILLQFNSHGQTYLKQVMNIGRKPPSFIKQKSYHLPNFSIKTSDFKSLGKLYTIDATSQKYESDQDNNSVPFTIMGFRKRMMLLMRGLSISLDNYSCLKTPFTRKLEMRPFESIKSMTRSPRGSFLVTVGVKAEITVWQVYRDRDRVTDIRSYSQWKPADVFDSATASTLRNWKLAIWDDAQQMVFCTNDSIILLQCTKTPNNSILYKPCGSFPLPDGMSILTPLYDTVKVLMPVTYQDVNGNSNRVLIAALESGHVAFWRISQGQQQHGSVDDPNITLEYHFCVSEQCNNSPGESSCPQSMFALDDALGDLDPDALRVTVGSISDNGDIIFWTRNVKDASTKSWIQSSKVSTGKKKVNSAKASGTKKVAILNACEDGVELTIWNYLSSEFTSGLEFSKTFPSSDSPLKLDWTTSPDLHPVLAVGFNDKIVIYSEERVDYYNPDVKWNAILTISTDIRTSINLSDFAWIWASHLVISSANQLYLHTRMIPEIASPLDNVKEPMDLYDLLSHLVGPLPYFHPQLLLQCLLAGKLRLVHKILCAVQERIIVYPNEPIKLANITINDFLTPTRYYSHDNVETPVANKFLVNTPHNQEYNTSKYNSYFEPSNGKKKEPSFDSSEKIDGSESDFDSLIEYLNNHQVPGFSQTEKMHLLVTVQTVLQVQNQRRTLDQNGMRYLVSMRSFFLYRNLLNQNTNFVKTIPKRTRLRYRDMLWAFHSQSQDILLEASLSACEERMTWENARALNLPLWIRSHNDLERQMEAVARSQYVKDEARDPESCCLIYFALRKHRLVQTLWKQAYGHTERTAMMKFLDNDFTQERWKTAAAKNAYALLSKKRFLFAAAFFMLADNLKDSIQVCLRKLEDFQLAVAICRLYEGDEGPVLRHVIDSYIIPLAFEKGWRRLASWAFWMIKRRDLAVRVLLTPFPDLLDTLDIPVELSSPHYDDPSLALLYLQLRSYSIQTARGAHTVSPSTEFNFVLHMAGIYCRMGCHVLALDLARSWPFLEIPTERARNGIVPAEDESLSRRRNSTIRRSTILDVDLTNHNKNTTTKPGKNMDHASQDENADPDNQDGIDNKNNTPKTNFIPEKKKVVTNEPTFDFSAFGM